MRYLFLIVTFLVFENASGQVKALDTLLKNRNYKSFVNSLSKYTNPDSDSSHYWFYRGKLHVQKREINKAFLALMKVDSMKLANEYKGWFYYVLGDSYRFNNQEEKAFSLKLKAQKKFMTSGNRNMANKINYDLHYTLASQDFLEYDGASYLNTFFENARQDNSAEQLLTAHLGLSFLGITLSNTENARFHLKEAEKYANRINTPEAKYKLHNYKAIFYQNYTDDIRLAEIHTDSMLYYANILNSPDRMESSLKTKAYTQTNLGRYREAIRILIQADRLSISENIYNRKKQLYQYLSLNYENLGQKDSAFFYYKKMVSYRDSINVATQNSILTLLETNELSQKNLILDAERIKLKSRSHWAIGLLVSITIISAILVAFYRNKRRLAEKDKELRAIDTRNEEKDRQRQRIAGELHDNLGGLIIAIQQSFDNLKVSKNRFQQEEEDLISKTRKLLDEAYQKVRNMAHLEDSASRNSGYWVDIIKDFAAIINESNQLSVEVQNHGTSNIINMSLENDLRQMTTELITNAVKHSKASEVSVDITGDENSITIIVEDNGVGLDTTQIKKQRGLGLYGMKKKVEELKGKLSIDSNPNKGSTFIIEISL